MALPRITRKSLLYRSGGSGGYCINHVEGCSHGCRYPCYAMLIKQKAGVVSSYEDWTSPRVVGNALELLERELRKKRDNVGSVHLCFSTDPFMHGHPEVSALSLDIIRALNARGIPCSTLTKGVHPVDDIDGDMSA